MSKRFVRDVARAVDHGLRAGTVVPLEQEGGIQLRLPITVRPRITPTGVARQLLRAIRTERLTRFVALGVRAGLPWEHRVSTPRFTVRAIEEYNIVTNRHVVWFDVLGMRAPGVGDTWTARLPWRFALAPEPERRG